MKKITHIMFAVSTMVVSVAGSALANPVPGPGGPAPVPEPGTFALLGLGAAGFALYKKFKK